MVEYLTGFTYEEVRTRAEGVALHVVERLRVLEDNGQFILDADQGIEDPGTRIELLLRKRDVEQELGVLRSIGSILGIIEQ